MSDDEALLLERAAPPFSPIVMFVCTFEAVINNINRTHEDLIGVLEPRGAIKALNCNFGHKVLPGFERFEKRPKSKQAPGARAEPRGRLIGSSRRRLAPANVRPRKPQGDATCFNSALEVTIIPGPEDNPPPAVLEYFARNPNKHYAVKSFPTTGKTQVPGVVCDGLVDGTFIAQRWAKYLTESGVAEDPSLPITVVEERPIMLNFKFFLYRASERVILNLSAIAHHLEVVKESGEALPYPVREIKHVQDGQNISFKFVSPAGKKVRVNMFFRGKVNILGAAEFETPRAIYNYLSVLIYDRWGEFINIQPLPDRIRCGRAAAKSAPEKAASPAHLAIPAESIIADDDLDALLGAVGGLTLDPAETAPPGEKAAIGIAALMVLAQGFEDDFGGL